MRYPTIILVAALVPCFGCGEGAGTQVSSGISQSLDFAPNDLDGLWQGFAIPVRAGNLPLELTLGFEAFGSSPSQVDLVHYSFPAIRSTGTVDYLALLSTYEVFFSSSGQLTLETRYLGIGSLGRFIDEQTTKILFMDEDLGTMVGTESIRVYEAGSQTINVDSVLRLDRLN